MSTRQTRYNKEIDILHDISYLLGRAESNDEMYKIAVEHAILNLTIDRLAIFLITGDNQVQGTYGTDIEGNVVDERWFTSSIDEHTFASEMIRNRTFIGFQQHTSLLHNFKNVGIGWNGYVTLWDGNEAIGWIACDNLITASPLKPSQVNILKMLGFIISQNIVRRKYQDQLIIANKELESKNKELEYLTSKLEQLVFIDPLTMIANRRALQRYLDDTFTNPRNNYSSLSILMLDIDNFKSINDKYGHLEGDQCLIAIAKRLTTIVQTQDFILARYGGEEFIFAFVGLNEAQLKMIAKEILSAVRELKISNPNSQNIHSLTLSIGAVHAPILQDISYIELIQAADTALYEAKSSGKDQLIFAQPIPNY
ncbi:GGDEF domain-containing protein [Vibrio fluminensis]|uniref:GGDEF domain-containing protein n=1 Tax=Vibrio fluminensis TaxID=2783614 RepID=UPI001887FC0C|nr:GGDEF domain-containing protein [Vibrio fluminensis]